MPGPDHERKEGTLARCEQATLMIKRPPPSVTGTAVSFKECQNVETKRKAPNASSTTFLVMEWLSRFPVGQFGLPLRPPATPRRDPQKGHTPLPPCCVSSATKGIEMTETRVVGQGRSALRVSGAQDESRDERSGKPSDLGFALIGTM